MKGTDLRIIFMGTPDFAVETLRLLVENKYNIVGVITAPDRPAGRGKKISESAVKKYAQKNNLPILQPTNLKDEKFIDKLRLLKADLQIVVAFRMLPKIVWNMPKLGTFNLHASLLPNYRGAAPLNWAIINNEKTTGVTTFLLDEKIDTGKILLQERIEIHSNDTVGDIHDKLMAIGAKLVIKTVDILATGNYKAIDQADLINEKDIKHAPKIFKDDCKINWNKKAEDIRNLIRGLSPYPAAWCHLVAMDKDEQTTLFKVFNTKIIDTQQTGNAGDIITDGETFLRVICGDNKLLELTDVQLAGKKRMNVKDFLRGFKNIHQFKFV